MMVDATMAGRGKVGTALRHDDWTRLVTSSITSTLRLVRGDPVPDRGWFVGEDSFPFGVRAPRPSPLPGSLPSRGLADAVR